MSKGNAIVVSAEPKGRHIEGVAGEAGIKPGALIRIVPGTARDGNGDFTFELWDGAANGERSVLMVADIGWEGQTNDVAYDANSRVRAYIPMVGEEINVRVKAAQNITVGDKLIQEANSGFAIETTGDPESEPLVALESAGVIAAGGELVHVLVSGV